LRKQQETWCTPEHVWPLLVLQATFSKWPAGISSTGGTWESFTAWMWLEIYRL
jgi:hypothetical protein